MPLPETPPGRCTHRDPQGPGEADGGHAAPAVGWEDHDVALMDGVLPVGRQQALQLGVLEANPIGKEREKESCQQGMHLAERGQSRAGRCSARSWGPRGCVFALRSQAPVCLKARKILAPSNAGLYL